MSRGFVKKTSVSSSASMVMYMSMLTMIVAFVVWSLISPIAPQLQVRFGLSEEQKSLLVATPVLLGSLFRIPIGMFTDRFGGRRVYTLLMLFLVIPLFGITTAHSFGMFIFWEVLLGIAGTSFAVGIGHVSAWFPPAKQGLVLGITALGNIGTAVAGFIVPGLYLKLGFNGMAYVMMLPVVLSAVVLWTLTRDASKDAVSSATTESQFMEQLGAASDSSTGSRTTAGAMMPSNGGHLHRESQRSETATAGKRTSFWLRPELWLLAFYYFITFGGFVAFGNYLPTLLQGQLHLQAVDAGFRAAGFVVLATLIRPVGGYLADRFNPNGLLLVVFLITGVCSITWATGINSMLATTISALLIAAMLGIGNGAVFKLVPTYFPATTGKATGIVGAIGGIGGFFPPLIMGAFRQNTGSYTGGFLLLTAMTVVGFVLVLLTNRTKLNRAKTHRSVPGSNTLQEV